MSALKRIRLNVEQKLVPHSTITDTAISLTRIIYKGNIYDQPLRPTVGSIYIGVTVDIEHDFSTTTGIYIIADVDSVSCGIDKISPIEAYTTLGNGAMVLIDSIVRTAMQLTNQHVSATAVFSDDI